MKRDEAIKLLKKQGTPEAKFALNFLQKTEGKVWADTNGKVCIGPQWVSK